MGIIKNPSEIELSGTIKMLIYGEPGVGKTSIALSAPSPVMLDFDGGVGRVNSVFHTDTAQITKWEDCLEFMAEDLSKYRTIVVDTAGKMLDFMSDYIIRTNPKMGQRDGSLSQKGYGARKVMFVNFLGQLTLLGKHIVFVAHEREDKDGDLRFIRPEIGGSSSWDLIKELDIVGFMSEVGTERTIQWSPTEKFYAKKPSFLPKSQVVPTIIDDKGAVTGKNLFLTELFLQYSEYMNEQRKTGEAYKAVVDGCRKKIQDIEDETSAGKVASEIASTEFIWDGRVAVRQMFAERLKQLGLKYNPEKGKYEKV